MTPTKVSSGPKLKPLCLLLTISPLTSAFATERFFWDITEYSPDKRLRLEARSPDNQGRQPDPWDGGEAFQRNFTYTLYVAADNEVVWQRKQESLEGSPLRIFVDDERWVVIWTRGGVLLIIDPRGILVGKLDLLEDALENTEVEEFVCWSLAQNKWYGLSLRYFGKFGQRTFFSIRTGWGRRILIDMERATLFQEHRDLLPVLDHIEREFVLRILRDAADLPQKQLAGNTRAPVLTAVHMAAQMRLKESVGLLKKLEAFEYRGRRGGIWATDLTEGEINPLETTENTLRVIVQSALRRLGSRPTGYPANSFRYYRRGQEGREYQLKQLSVPREEKVDSLRIGMSVMDVLVALGAPDFVTGHTWQYDIDEHDPYTLNVVWDDARTVADLSTIKPACWQELNQRDKRFFCRCRATAITETALLREAGRSTRHIILIPLTVVAMCLLVALVICAYRRYKGHSVTTGADS